MNETRNISDYTVVIVRPDGDQPIVLTLGEFLEDNEFEESEIADIKTALADGRTYVGGGGASPIWKVEVYR